MNIYVNGIPVNLFRQRLESGEYLLTHSQTGEVLCTGSLQQVEAVVAEIVEREYPGLAAQQI